MENVDNDGDNDGDNGSDGDEDGVDSRITSLSGLIEYGSVSEKKEWSDELFIILRSSISPDTHKSSISLASRIKALKTLGNQVGAYLENQDGKLHFLLDFMLSTLDEALECGVDEGLECFQVFLDIESSYPVFFQPRMQVVLDKMFAIIGSNSLVPIHRIDGLGFVLSMRTPEITLRLFQMMINLLRDVDDVDDWQQLGDAYAGVTSNYTIGRHILDSLSEYLDEPTLVRFVVEIFPEHMDALEWQTRNAGLWMLSVIGAHSYKVTVNKRDFDPVINRLIEAFEDSNVRVRFVAMLVLDFFYQEIKDDWRLFLDDLLLGLLFAIKDNASNPMIQERAASTLSTLITDCKPQLLITHLETMVNVLVDLFENRPELYMSALKSLAALAYVAVLTSQPVFDDYCSAVAGHITEETDGETFKRAYKTLQTYKIRKGEQAFKLAKRNCTIWGTFPRNTLRN